MQFKILVLFFVFIGNFSFVYSDEFEGKNAMNDITLDQFKGFEKDWKLVTVRFRKDTEEMRWTFANDIAWKALDKGITDYPEGSVFAKIGIRTMPDNQFVSSAVPVGARRYQFMVRSKKKYVDTDGWGYALFDVNGKTYPENPIKVSQSCNACHAIVESRGRVFSQTFDLAPYVRLNHFSGKLKAQAILFKSVNVSDVFIKLKKLLPPGQKTIRVIENSEITASIFQGTLDEMKPTLEREAHESKAPAALISDSKDRFAIVFAKDIMGCKPGRSYVSLSTKLDGDIQKLEYCNP